MIYSIDGSHIPLQFQFINKRWPQTLDVSL